MSPVAYKRRSAAAGVAAELPEYVELCDPTLRKLPPSGDDWIHEIKYDGYRLQLRKDGSTVTLQSRKRVSWTGEFSFIAEIARSIPARRAIIDGEITVAGKHGLPDFQALRRQIGKRSTEVVYNAFDLLWLDGEDLRQLPLRERKARLQRLLKKVHPSIAFADALDGVGPEIFRHACRMGLEGIVSKRRNSLYVAGRSESWIKSKCQNTDNFPIVAFVEKLGAKPRRIASLYVGRWIGKRLLYAGKVQTGYTMEMAREVRDVLDPYIIKQSPLTERVNKPKATWVRPEVQAEVKFTGLTDEGLLREAIFKGLRDDVALPKVKAAALSSTRRPSSPKPKIGVPRENILQLLPDAVAPTKEELARYWEKVGERALKYLARRPLKLVRHTHGTIFYHKGRLPPIPDSVHQLRIEKREGGEGVRLWVDSVEGFLDLVSIGAVEFHAWNATVDDIEHADTLVFDLDPGEGIDWDFVTDSALQLREILRQEGLKSWPKLTGGKGVHLMVPVTPELTHDQAHRYCRAIAETYAATDDRYTTSAALASRPRHLFIDYLRNGRGTTAVATYSPRAREGFPIAAPVTWKQIEMGIRPDAFTTVRPFHPHPRRG
jgi:bifunctional non-homologous end joining protein LigD